MRARVLVVLSAVAGLLFVGTTTTQASETTGKSAAPGFSVTSHGIRGLGAKTSPQQRISARSNGVRATQPPDSVDLSKNNPPVGDQGALGSCVAWAEDYGVAGWYANRTGHTPPGPYAPMYIYSQIQAYYGWSDGGAYSNDGYDFSNRSGLDTQADYFQGNYDWIDQPTAAERANAASNKLGLTHWIFSGSGQGQSVSDSIKTVLASGKPITVGIPIFHHWDVMSGTDDVYTDADVDWTTYRGNHEVFAYGYNTTGILVQNSWGTWWGNGGRAVIAWDFLNKDANDATYTDGFVSTFSTGNRVTNASFESNLIGWGSFQGKLSRIREATPTVQNAGKFAARTTWVKGAAFTVGDNSVPTIGPWVKNATYGSQWTTSAWVRAANKSSVGKPVRLYLRERAPGPGYTVYQDIQGPTYTLTSAWQRIQGSTLTVLTAGDSVGMRVEQANAGRGNAFDSDVMWLRQTG